MAEKIRPLYDKILVKRLESEEKTAGGLFIPASAQEKPQAGRVQAVGAGRILTDGSLVPLAVKINDIVYFGKYSGTEIDKGFLIIREDEILGVVE
jgi:chaperonin GroES